MPRRFCIQRTIRPQAIEVHIVRENHLRQSASSSSRGDIGGASDDVFFPAPPAIILRARFWLVESNARCIALSLSPRSAEKDTNCTTFGRAFSTKWRRPLLSFEVPSEFSFPHLVSKSPSRTRGRLPALTPPPMFLGSKSAATAATTRPPRPPLRDSSRSATAVRLRRRRKKQQQRDRCTVIPRGPTKAD